jgi:HEAT repeat protein
MNTEPISFQKVLDTLQSDRKDFPRRYLQEFSDIGPLELKILLDVWPQVDLNRKLTLLEDLIVLADTDTLVSFDDFARALLTDPDPQVRTRSIRLLNENESTDLLPSYLDMLRNDPDVNVRAEAARILNVYVDLGELEEIPDALYHQVEDALLASAASEDDARVRRAALESLGYSSRLEVATLIESSFHREDPNWQASALVAMGRSADEERWADSVTRSLVNEDDRIRKAAVQAAGELSLKSARVLLLKMLGEEEEEGVLSAIIWSLSQIGGEDVRTYLESLLDQIEEDDEQVSFLEEALDNLAFTEDLDRFDLLAVDPDDELVEIDVDEDDEK